MCCLLVFWMDVLKKNWMSDWQNDFDNFFPVATGNKVMQHKNDMGCASARSD